jgi:transposase
MTDALLLDPERPAVMLRGGVCRLYPSASQARAMDLWRRRCIQLWNLLLELEQAAYSGENRKSKLGWRSIWRRVVEDSHAEAVRVAREGKLRKDGTFRKAPGARPEPPPLDEGMLGKIRSPLKAHLARQIDFDQISGAEIANLPVYHCDPKAHVRAPTDDDVWQMLQFWKADGINPVARLPANLAWQIAREFLREVRTTQWESARSSTFHWRRIVDRAIAALTEKAAPKQDRQNTTTQTDGDAEIAALPRLFIWEHELQKVMARLKQAPRARWIADLPSHAAQSVVKDLIKALQAMLRERKKRLSGAGGLDTGFPKFKKNRYAAGSVYLANTQVKFKTKPKRRGEAPDGARVIKEFSAVKLPNGVGWMECRLSRKIAAALEYGEADLMGARIWRRGEDWYMSCQWRLPVPAPLPKTGRVAAVKIAARIPITICDDRGQVREFEMPPIDKDRIAAHRAAGRRQALALEARKAKAKKREAYAKKRAAQKAARDLAVKPLKRARIPLSGGFYAAAATLARLEGEDADIRADWMHKTTTQIVETYDAIAVQKMQVAKMMKKEKPPKTQDELRQPEETRRRRSLKAARALMRSAAMARIQQVLKYKATERRGPQAYIEIPPHHVTASASSVTGTIFPEWRDGRKIVRAREALPDGGVAVTHQPRNRNAARVIAKHLEKKLGGGGLQSGRGGMGSRKHGQSGHPGKSPKLRHAMKREAERQERKDRSKLADPKGSVGEAFKGKPS